MTELKLMDKILHYLHSKQNQESLILAVLKNTDQNEQKLHHQWNYDILDEIIDDLEIFKKSIMEKELDV